MAPLRQKEIKIALTARSKDEGTVLSHTVHGCGFDNIQIFTNTRDTLEVAKRVQFQIFVTHNDFPDMTGLTMVQALRATGNYGIESHLFLIDNISPETMLVLVELNIHHALSKPYSVDRVSQKLLHLWKEETHITPAEQEFREAHAALCSGLSEMAHDMSIQIVKAHGPSEKVLLLLGDVAMKEERPLEARKYYEAAKKFNPNSSLAIHKLAQTYMQVKDFTHAAELMKDLAKLNPLNVELLANFGLSSYEVGNMNDAKAAMGKLQSLDKNRKDASEILTKVAINEGDITLAMKNMGEGRDTKELIQLINNEGIRLSQRNDVAGAIRMYTQSIKVIGSHPAIYAIFYNLGLSYMKAHDNENAKIWLKKALDAKPNFEKAMTALARLEPKRA